MTFIYLNAIFLLFHILRTLSNQLLIPLYCRGFTARQLAEFGLSALQHSGSDVRKAGERVLLALYQHHPLAVKRTLPQEDEPTRKNVLFRNLFEQLEIIDKKVCLGLFPSYNLIETV